MWRLGGRFECWKRRSDIILEIPRLASFGHSSYAPREGSFVLSEFDKDRPTPITVLSYYYSF
jgi:hypothetical protein